MRSPAPTKHIRLTPHKELSLEQAIDSSPTTNSWKFTPKSIARKKSCNQPTPRAGKKIRAARNPVTFWVAQPLWLCSDELASQFAALHG